MYNKFSSVSVYYLCAGSTAHVPIIKAAQKQKYNSKQYNRQKQRSTNKQEVDIKKLRL
jgi:hypothetical protein